MFSTASKLDTDQFARVSAAVTHRLLHEQDMVLVQTLTKNTELLQKFFHQIFESLQQKCLDMDDHTAAIFEEVKSDIQASALQNEQGKEEGGAIAEGIMNYIETLCSGYTIDSPTYTVEMDDRYPLSHWLTVGNYVVEHPDVTDKKFPLELLQDTEPGARTVKIEVPRFNWCISGQDVREEIRKRNCRPATPHEMLAFGCQHATVVTKKIRWPIISFAHPTECPHCKGRELLSICKKEEGGIRAEIVNDNVGYFGYCHFAAVKVQQN